MFEPQYNALLAEIQSSNMSKRASENGNDESLDIYKK
jgi:hypothetical protein